MDLLDTLVWYWGNILDYAREMLPCMLLALAAFWALLPLRRRRLAARGAGQRPLAGGRPVAVYDVLCRAGRAHTVSGRLLAPLPTGKAHSGGRFRCSHL